MKRNLISHDRIKVIFKHVHEILQCHQLFSMALSDRTKEWISNDVIGDVIYASVSKNCFNTKFLLQWNLSKTDSAFIENDWI